MATTRRSFASRKRRRSNSSGYTLIALIAVTVVASDPSTRGEIAARLRQLNLSAEDRYTLEGAVLLLLALGVALHAGLLRPFWHWVANKFAVEPPRVLAKPWVIDGDTLDDRATGVRYRLANIDAPETGDNAKCFYERARGEQARATAIHLVRAAATVTVRRTFRFDQYGRRVAFVLVDGQDLGELLVERGLAVCWSGARRKWCGRRGGLARIAATGAASHACETCRRWS